MLALAGIPALHADPIELQTTRIALKPNEPGQLRVGSLRYRGGLVIESSDARFGGLSGLLVSADGASVLAVSDDARWVTFKLDYREGELVGAHDGELWPMRDLDGVPMRLKQGDAESLAALSPKSLRGDVAVGFEGRARIWRYAFGRAGADAVPTVVPTPPELAAVRRNKGLEALTRLKDGRLLAITEATLDESGNMIGWILNGKKSEPLSFRRRDDFDVSDAAALPGGDVLVLERRFNMLEGLFMRLRRIPAADIRPDAVLDGTVLASMGPAYAIDNMEGLATRRGPDGETLIYVIADDNFNRLERTILLMFALDEPRLAQPRPR